MAIQLNDRDQLIFRFIAEHQVLLEKHISWFIACDDKPVLIRDRLRKLFYLDYLLCERHRDTLPWWTTPTKPLVYMLSPMTRNLISTTDEGDLADCALQRHLLEVANLRMLMLMAQKDGQISAFEWKTQACTMGTIQPLDAMVSFNRGGISYKAGIVNHSAEDMSNVALLKDKLEASFDGDGVEMIFVISRDQVRQQMLQQSLNTKLSETSTNRVLFATHQEIYKAGIVKARWQNAAERTIACFVDQLTDAPSCKAPVMSTAHAMPA